MILYRTMQAGDISAGLSLCRKAGWNQLERDWKLFLDLNPEGCRVGVDENDNVVGTVTTLPYQHHFTWIGMVLVNPDHRREGIGTQLLQEAINLAIHHETLKLDATPAGREVYLKLNFVDEYNITRMKLDSHGTTTTLTSRARPMQKTDFPAILKLDGEVFGADRHTLLESNFLAASHYAWIIEDHGNVEGFCFGRPGFDFNHIGPIIANNNHVARELLSAALRHETTKPTILDVLHHSPEWFDFVKSVGFKTLRPLIRMYRGPNFYPGLPEKQFAILGPEFG